MSDSEILRSSKQKSSFVLLLGPCRMLNGSIFFVADSLRSFVDEEGPSRCCDLRNLSTFSVSSESSLKLHFSPYVISFEGENGRNPSVFGVDVFR